MKNKWLILATFSMIAALLAVLWFTNNIASPQEPPTGKVPLDQLNIKTRNPQPAGKNLNSQN